uniref:Uncharacterized protein n=1 Tax=Siphoviridae sp. ctHip2 TaxID=2827830 RepID=A0A8S5RVK9_9CAUD|nr:MAG TPA: hypothetical protein [Siphoviridae sp. ctHip2]
MYRLYRKTAQSRLNLLKIKMKKWNNITILKIRKLN